MHQHKQSITQKDTCCSYISLPNVESDYLSVDRQTLETDMAYDD